MSQAQMMMKQWSLEMDTALVCLVNELCRSLAVSSSRLHAHELMLTDTQLASQQYTCLHSESEYEKKKEQETGKSMKYTHKTFSISVDTLH